MKTYRSLSVILLSLILAITLVSCFSIPGIGNPLTDALEKRVTAEISSAVDISQITHKMMFTLVYSQIFHIGGFNASYFSLEETQGLAWRLESTDEYGKTSAVEAERALLKKLSNGDAWWYLTWHDEEQKIEFEVLFDKELNPKKIRYYNDDVKRVEEALFDPPSMGADPVKAESADYKTFEEFYKETNTKTSKETLKLGSGTWNCTRIERSTYDEEEKTTYKYTWWVDTDAAGGLVKFEWTKSGSKEKLKGELVSINKGYTTKFKSF